MTLDEIRDEQRPSFEPWRSYRGCKSLVSISASYFFFSLFGSRIFSSLFSYILDFRTLGKNCMGIHLSFDFVHFSVR
jgi:hypothetical protein